MTNNNLSPIKLSSVLGVSEQIDVMSTFEVDKKNGASVLYNTIFSQKKIDELTAELLADVQYTVDNNITDENNVFRNDDGLMKYTLLMIIKHFSHFKDEIGDKYEDKVAAMLGLYEIGLFNLFFDEIFDTDEVIKVTKHIDKTATNIITLIEEDTKAIEEDMKKTVKPKANRKTRVKKTTPTNLN